jgi:hypothetical protein
VVSETEKEYLQTWKRKKIEALPLKKDMLNKIELVTDGFKSTVTTERRAIQAVNFIGVRTSADLVRAPGTTIGTRATTDLLSLPRLLGIVTSLMQNLVMDRIGN